MSCKWKRIELYYSQYIKSRCYIPGIFPTTVHPFIGSFMVTWHLTMKLLPNALSGQHCKNYDVKRETVHCYPRNVDCCCTWSERAVEGGLILSQESQRVFQNLLLFCFVLLYNKSLNDWSLGKQWILFPSNLNVSLDFVSGNIEILGKQNSLFPSGPVTKCLLLNFFGCHSKQFPWN